MTAQPWVGPDQTVTPGPNQIDILTADRKRWSLVDKLPEMFSTIEDRAAAAREARDQQREAARRRRERWEAAVPEAREKYLTELNRTRILDQTAAWRSARDLREYAAVVEDRARESTMRPSASASLLGRGGRGPRPTAWTRCT